MRWITGSVHPPRVIADLRQVDAVDAADVQRHDVRAVGLLAAREHVDAAIDAELVADRVAVEEILLQVLGAGTELEARRRHEHEVQALLGADRAVAGGHHRHVGGAFEADLPAMAAAGVDLVLGHDRPSPQSGHEAIAHPRRIIGIA